MSKDRIRELLDLSSPEERQMYMDGTTTEYYHFLESQPEFQAVREKIEAHHKLTNDEWNYVLAKYFLVTCHAISEEDKVRLSDTVFSYLAKIGKKLVKKSPALANECLTMIEFAQSIKLEKQINQDLGDGLQVCMHHRREEDLERLARQHREATIFRDNQDAFFDEYNKRGFGDLSVHERMYIHAFHQSYDREKQIQKEYGSEKGN